MPDVPYRPYVLENKEASRGLKIAAPALFEGPFSAPKATVPQ